ncbi:MAG: hypothetical protein II954_01170 [Synergistaceae bacterium]|nr:hypothetical protein [Synergistaceae bacterium]
MTADSYNPAYNALELNRLLAGLDNEDLRKAISYVEFLYDQRRKADADRNGRIMREIQALIGDDKGWDSEEEMIKDVAEFRRSRMVENLS